MSESDDSRRRTSSDLIPKNQVASPTGQHVQRPRFLPAERDPFKFYLQNRLEPSRILRNSSGEHFRTFQSSQVARTIQTLRNLPAENSWKTHGTFSAAKKNATPRSPTSSFSNSPIPLEPSNCTPELCRTLRSFCNIALQSLKIRTVFVAILKKTANLAAVAWSMTSMSTLNPFPMAGTDGSSSPRNQKGGVPEHCQLMKGTIECCLLR